MFFGAYQASMRWLLFFVAVSTSADCTSRLLYRTADYMTNAVIDDGGLYVSLLLAGDIERIDLATGERSIVHMGLVNAWDIQHGLLVTPATIGQPEHDVERITIRDGSVYWLESDGVLRRMILGGGATMTVAEHVAQYAIFEDRSVFISEGKLFWKRLTDAEPTLVLTDVDSISSVASDAILVTRFTRTGVYEALGQVLRVSWSGDSEETLYQTKFVTYHNTLDFAVAAADGITYIGLTMSYATTLLGIQDGFASERYRTPGPIWILGANEHWITVADWGQSTGMHDVVQLQCPETLRVRAVR